MRRGVVIFAGLVLITSALSQERRASSTRPNQFEIGRHTFIDIGPPFDFYDVLIVRPTTNGTLVEKITLTPVSDECISWAPVETEAATISESPGELLGSVDPCAIPEKELKRELKRRKNRLAFSGANVVMRVQCGSQTRLIRSDILDRDMFDPAPNTPEHTSWTMRLLERLGQAVGPGVLDKPLFPTPGKKDVTAKGADSETLRDLSAGKFDSLFQGAPHKVSDLYRAAQSRPLPPIVRLSSSTPVQPEVFTEPVYPPLARMARIQGAVAIKFDIDGNGSAINLVFESGHPLFRGAVEEAVRKWKFPTSAYQQQIQATLEFVLNCPNTTEPR